MRHKQQVEFWLKWANCCISTESSEHMRSFEHFLFKEAYKIKQQQKLTGTHSCSAAVLGAEAGRDSGPVLGCHLALVSAWDLERVGAERLQLGACTKR